MKKWTVGFSVVLVLLACLVGGCQSIQEVTTPKINYVSVAGYEVAEDTQVLNLEGKSGYDPELLNQELAELLELKSVTFGDDAIPVGRLEQLRADFPEVEFTAVVTHTVGGKEFREDATRLDLSGMAVPADLDEAIKIFPHLEEVDLHGTGIQREELLALKTAWPDLHFGAEVELGGEVLSTDEETLDFNGKKLRDYDTFMETFVLFDRVTQAEMCDCGFSNEQLDGLRSAYPNTKFVWRIYLGKWSLRTDAVAFSVLITNYSHRRMTAKDIEVLKYCTDLQALDLGHQAIEDISVIGEYLTELRILILADNKLTDLSPLANLPHLHYLEFFVNRITDLTPLAQCKELVDLNISYNYGISDITPLLDLPLLERLWLESVRVSQADVNLLRQTYPDATIINRGSGSIDQGWRKHDRYFAMIDMYRKTDYMSEEFSKYDGLTEHPAPSPSPSPSPAP